MPTIVLRIRFRALACGLALCLLAGDACATLHRQPAVGEAGPVGADDRGVHEPHQHRRRDAGRRAHRRRRRGCRPGPGKSARPIAGCRCRRRPWSCSRPASEHIALVKLARTLKLGERVALTLTIEGRRRRSPGHSRCSPKPACARRWTTSCGSTVNTNTRASFYRWRATPPSASAAAASSSSVVRMSGQRRR